MGLEIIQSTIRKARKKHICDYCLYPINIGEKYESTALKYDYLYTWKNHLKCQELVRILNMEGDEGITSADFYEYIEIEFYNLHYKLNSFLYQQKKLNTIDLKNKLEFVYNQLINKLK